jgi:hypothetical protein
MTPEQEAHLRAISVYFISFLEQKYRAGAEKHKSDLLSLTTRQLLEEALAENIDQYVYIVSALQKL